MNHFEDEENVWGDAPPSGGINPTVSVLFSPTDNPYSSAYVNQFESDNNESGDDQLQEVDFKSDTGLPSEGNIYNELSSTMNAVSREEKQPDEPEKQPEEEVSPEEIETIKQRNKQLLSSLIQDDDNDKLLSPTAVLDDTPDPSETLFSNSRGSDLDDGPLGNILNLASVNETARMSDGGRANTSSIASPNKKTRVFRPRRVIKKETTVDDASTPNPLDPLSSRTENETDLEENSFAVKKQSIIASVDEPLFDLNKATSPSTAPGSPERIIRTPSLKRPPQHEPIDHFDITVGDPIKVGELTNAHIVYTISTRTKSTLLKNEDTVVTRRYRDFLWLYNQLSNNHPGRIIPPAPEKQAYGRFDEKFIENRRLALEKMLIKISKEPVMQKDSDFILFLQSENFAAESKEREFIHYHGATGDETHRGEENDFSTSSILNTASSNSGNRGFLSSLIGLNIPKYVESDQFILSKQVYVENLDQQLRSLSKTLDFILEKREEVIVSLNELILIIQQLTDLEINTELSELFANFEELHTKVRELLERTNMQQILTLGSTIDEYTRTIGSIRNCFETRFKLCNNIVTLQSRHSKLQKNLIKFKSKNHNQLEKIKRYEDELNNLESTISKQEEFKMEFNRNLQKDLDKFEFDKVEDFKSTIEIYWEGLIERQKELIELWESFYDKCKFE